MVALARREDQDLSVARTPDQEAGAADAATQTARPAGAAGGARNGLAEFTASLGANDDHKAAINASLCLLKAGVLGAVPPSECIPGVLRERADEEEEVAREPLSPERLVQFAASCKVAAQVFAQVTTALRGLTRNEDVALPEFLTLGQYVDAFLASGAAGEEPFREILSRVYILRRALTTSSLPTKSGEPLGTYLERILNGEFGGQPEFDIVPNLDVSAVGEDEFRVPLGPIAARGKDGDARWQWARDVHRVMHTRSDFLEFARLVDVQANPAFGCVHRCDWQQVVIGTFAGRLSRTVDGRVMSERDFHGIVQAIERLAQASADVTAFFLTAGATTAFGSAGVLEKIAMGISATCTYGKAVSTSIDYHGFDALWGFGNLAAGLFSLADAFEREELLRIALAITKAHAEAVSLIGTDPDQAKTLKIIHTLVKSAAGK